MARTKNEMKIRGYLGNVDYQLDRSGRPLARFSVVTSRFVRTNEGDSIKKDTWHKCVAFRDDAKRVEQFKAGDNKGGMVEVIGSREDDSYAHKTFKHDDGKPFIVRSSRCVANEVNFFGGQVDFASNEEDEGNADEDNAPFDGNDS